MKNNIIAAILALIVIMAFWATVQIPAAWDWMNELAWHWALVVAVAGFISDRLVKLTTWKGDDALWAIIWKDVLGRRGK